jgi:2-haloacid dehalogenase
MHRPEALAFDMYGTLVDPIRNWQQLEVYLGGSALPAAELWRSKQLEYTFRLTAMQHYEDFEWVTRKSLDFALATLGYDLTHEQRDTLVGEYNHLEPFGDVREGLRQVRSKAHTTAVLSNGSPRMLRAVAQAARLEDSFKMLISVDEVRTYKPSPLVYQHAADRLARPIAEVRLISSNPFDVIGAAAAGMQVAWLNRSSGVFDTLAPIPDVVATSLGELAEWL